MHDLFFVKFTFNGGFQWKQIRAILKLNHPILHLKLFKDKNALLFQFFLLLLSYILFFTNTFNLQNKL